MRKATKPDAPPRSPLETGSALYHHFWNVFLRGVAIIVPVIVTVYLVSIALTYVGRALEPFVGVLEYFGLIGTFRSFGLVQFLIELNVYGYVVDFLSELIALAVLLGVVLLVGSVGHNRYGERLIDGVDLLIASIPGVGTVYKSFRRMGDVMLTSEEENFQDVKLVQCLDDDMFVIGFETSTAPSAIEDATDNEEMTTLFIPMAPNPVTGGFLTYVPTDRVYEIDMTVEDGVKSILTSGVAAGHGASNAEHFGLEDVRDVAHFDQIQDAIPGPPVEEGPERTTGESSEASESDGVDKIE